MQTRRSLLSTFLTIPALAKLPKLQQKREPQQEPQYFHCPKGSYRVVSVKWIGTDGNPVPVPSDFSVQFTAR